VSVLSARSIRELVTRYDLVRLPGASGREALSAGGVLVQPCSVDVTLDAVGYAGGQTIVSGEWDTLTLTEGAFALGCTREVFRIPSDVVGLVVGKSSVARLGMQVECAGLVDAGFEGQLVLELTNLLAGPSLALAPGMRIAQVMFMWLDGEVEASDLYGSPGMGSHYQGQRGITRSHLRMP
jgi:deoxycytidine triphosphate deaminase